MGTRSLQASQKGLEKANLALAQYSLSQNALAEDLGLSRQTVNNFFKGKAIDRENFALICDRLGLDLQNTVAISTLGSKPSKPSDRSHIDAVVQEVRHKADLFLLIK
jgi:transcriptional regulator with XRE-family HTH domain